MDESEVKTTLGDKVKATLYFYCEICGKKFGREDNLRYHKKNEHNPKPATCRICCLSFPSESKRLYHMKTEHRPMLQCEHCEYQSPRLSRLKKHMEKHSAATLQCGYCEKLLKNKCTLEIHEREHTGERPFKCEVCQKGFKSSSILLTHKKGVHKIVGPKAKSIEVTKRIRKKPLVKKVKLAT